MVPFLKTSYHDPNDDPRIYAECYGPQSSDGLIVRELAPLVLDGRKIWLIM